MKKILLLSVLVLMLGVMVLGVACGAKSDADQVKDVVNGFASAYNSKNYDKVLDYMDLTGMESYKDMIKASMADSRETEGKMTVQKIENVTVSGTTATASVTTKADDGTVETDTLSFKKVGDDWKIVASSLQE